MTIGCGTPWLIGCDGETFQTSSVSASLRQASEQVVPISLMKILEKWAECSTSRPIPPSTRRWTRSTTASSTPAWVACPHQVSTSVLSSSVFGEPVLQLILGGGADLDGVAEELGEAGGDGPVHAVGIALGHPGPVAIGVLVEVFAPDGDADRRGHDHLVFQCGLAASAARVAIMAPWSPVARSSR